MNYIIKNTPFIFLGGSVIGLGLGLFFGRLFKSRDKEENTPGEVMEAIFFPEEITDRNFSKFGRLLDRIRGTRRSIDLCLYILTLKPLADAVITLRQTGVNVRWFSSSSSSNILMCRVLEG